MLSVERNLDELFDYTQGLIKELQEKNKSILKAELSSHNASPGVSLSCFKQIREDMLKYKAWQKKQGNPPHEDALQKENSKINNLEKQWMNQKNENQSNTTPSTSFMLNSKSKQEVCTELRTPTKIRENNYQERCKTEIQAPPYDEFIALEQNNYLAFTNETEGDTCHQRRSYSAKKKNMKRDSTPLTPLQTFEERRRSQNWNKAKAPIEKEASPCLKPSKSMTEIKNWRVRTPEKGSNTMHKKTPTLQEVHKFMQSHIEGQIKSSSLRDKIVKTNNRSCVKPNVGPRDFYGEIKDQSKLKIQRKSESEKITTLEAKIPNPFQEELSEIEQKERFELDIEMSDSTAKIYSKRSSIVNEMRQQCWMLEEMLKEESESNQKLSERLGNNARLSIEPIKSTPLAIVEGNRRHVHISLADMTQQFLQAKTPIKSVNGDGKTVIDLNGTMVPETKNVGKIRGSQTGSRWNNTSQKVKVMEIINRFSKENKEGKVSVSNGVSGNTSIYSQILERSHGHHAEIRNVTEVRRRSNINEKRSTSISRVNSKGKSEKKMDEMNKSVSSKSKLQAPQAPLNEGDRLYMEILQKLNKEKAKIHAS